MSKFKSMSVILPVSFDNKNSNMLESILMWDNFTVWLILVITAILLLIILSAFVCKLFMDKLPDVNWGNLNLSPLRPGLPNRSKNRKHHLIACLEQNQECGHCRRNTESGLRFDHYRCLNCHSHYHMACSTLHPCYMEARQEPKLDIASWSNKPFDPNIKKK